MSGRDLITHNEISQAIDQEDTAALAEYYSQSPEVFSAYCFSAEQKNALHYAAYNGKLQACQCLLALGMDMDSETVRWSTPLCEAASQGHEQVVKYLVGEGCLIDGTTDTISTPLMGAITFRHTDIARFLIEQGADINRIHLMTHKTPLDLSRMWRVPEIEQLLLQRGAKGRLAPGEMEGQGSGILAHTSRIGQVLPVVLKEDTQVQLRLAVINKGKQKLLFTLGLFAVTEPKKEFNMVLPVEWNIYDMRPENQFPVDLMWLLATQVQKGDQIDEHYFVSAQAPPYDQLAWPDGIAGFYPADVDWGLEKADTQQEVPVQLLSLLPVKQTKKLPLPDVQKNRAAKWAKLTLKLPHKL